MEKKVRIAIVDDNYLFRQGFSYHLTSIGYSIFGDFKNGEDFISHISSENLPDFVFTTLNMFPIDGYELTSWLKENYPKVNALALCRDEDDSEIQKMIDSGARGVIFKDIDPNEINVAIKATLKKGFYKSPQRDRDF